MSVFSSPIHHSIDPQHAVLLFVVIMKIIFFKLEKGFFVERGEEGWR